MLNGIIIGVIIAAAVGLGLFVYIRLIVQHTAVTAAALDKPTIVAGAQGWWQKLDARLMGWKTIILAWIAALAQAISLAITNIESLKDLPWALVFEEKIANYITFGVAALIPITSAIGQARAARTQPVAPAVTGTVITK